MQTHQNWSDVVARLGVRDETSSGVLYTLQRSDNRLRKSCESSVAVIKSAKYEYRDWTLGDFLTS